MRQAPRMRDIDHLTDRDVAVFYLWAMRLKAICDHHALVKECKASRTPQWTRGLDGEPQLIGWNPAKQDRPKCGARTRTGAPCKAPAVAGGKRCRMHGGASTGPRTAKGLKRSLAAASAGWQKWNAGRQAAKAVTQSD
jgi:hypothetical protein